MDFISSDAKHLRGNRLYILKSRAFLPIRQILADAKITALCHSRSTKVVSFLARVFRGYWLAGTLEAVFPSVHRSIVSG